MVEPDLRAPLHGRQPYQIAPLGKPHAEASGAAEGVLKSDELGLRLRLQAGVAFARARLGAGRGDGGAARRALALVAGVFTDRPLAFKEILDLFAGHGLELQKTLSQGLQLVLVLGQNASGLLISLVDETAHLVVDLARRSEEHTSELQSRLHLVCRLLLEKKKKYIS